MKSKTRSETMEETRCRLLLSARRSFGADGYAATVMDELTAAAGVTRGALYHHFGDKKGLLLAVARQQDAEIEAGLAAAESAAPDPWQGFKRRCRAYLQAVTEPEAQRILLRDAPAVLGVDFVQAGQRQCVTAIAERLRGLMTTGKSGRRNRRRWRVCSMAHWWRPRPGPPAPSGRSRLWLKRWMRWSRCWKA